MRELKSRFVAKAQEIGHLPNSTTLLAEHFKRDTDTIREWCKEFSVDLQAMRASAKNAAGEPLEKPNALLGISIIELFDKLRPCFQAESEADEPAEDERDPRATWIAWRVFLAAAFGVPAEVLLTDTFTGEPMPIYPGVDDATMPRGAAAVPVGATHEEIYAACTGRTDWPQQQAKIVSLIVGRRGGKSYITAIIGIYLACCRRYKLNLGTKGMVMILARDREQAGVIRGYVLAFLRAIEELNVMIAGETQKLIELTNGITIEVRAVSDKGAGTRGYTVVGALLDEIAFWPTDAMSAKQDKKVLQALRPAMFGIRGAMIVMLSSPYAKRGELYTVYRNGYGQQGNARYFVWQADTLSMRPESDPELLSEIRDEYEEDPDNAKAEYGAQFRSDLEAIFSKQTIEALSIEGRFERGYVKDLAPYRAFVDPSGGSSDSYVLAIAHDERRTVNGLEQVVAVLDKVIEWTPRFDPEKVSIEVVDACKSFKVTGVTGDAYAGEWPRDPLKKRGLTYTLSERTRSEIYLDMLPLVNSSRVELLDAKKHARTVNQFANLERRPGRGKDVVDHPAGSHDDCANAVAGVLVSGASHGSVLGAVW